VLDGGLPLTVHVSYMALTVCRFNQIGWPSPILVVPPLEYKSLFEKVD